MLLNLREYHRPADEGTTGGLARALEILSRSGISTVPLAGGDILVGSGDEAVEAVVDLQGLGLDTVTIGAGELRIGAMVTRTDLSEAGRDEATSLLRLLTRRCAAVGWQRPTQPGHHRWCRCHGRAGRSACRRAAGL